MKQEVNAEIIAVGTEILLGEITDTNSVHIARSLRDIGVNLYYMTTVGDNEHRVASAVQIALGRAGIVIMCGGLGPTVDDVTRQGIARAVGRPLEFRQDLYDQIVARFEAYRVSMTQNNRQQAFLPQGATAIENPVGTAPGFIVEEGDKSIISLPGVPREMKFLMSQEVIPYILDRYQSGLIRVRVLRTAGIGESTLDDMLGREILENSNPTVGLAAHHGVIDIRITAKAQDEQTAVKMLDDMENRVMSQVGTYVFGQQGAEIERVLADLLYRNRLQLVVVEAGIEGAAIEKFAAVSQTSPDVIALNQQFPTPADLARRLREDGYITDDNLRDLAAAAAQMWAEQAGAAAGIAIVSSPDVDENADRDYATAAAVFVGGRVHSRVYGFGAKSELAKDWVSRWSMALTWRMLKEYHHVE